jgi:hypothetical protein
MAEWPGTEELTQLLNLGEDGEENWGDTLDRALAAAIDRVKLEVGNWDEYEDEPDEALAHAALRMAELIMIRPEASDLSRDPTYQRLLYGHRRTLGVA